MKTTFITTVFNEAKNIRHFLKSLNSQTKQPHEIIIVDGGSTDKTLSEISNFKFQIPNKNIKIIQKKGNRSVGRNEAIKNATGDIIVCSDAGNILDKDWIKNIIKPFKDSSVDVVAGYYRPQTKTVFEKCLAAYTCVMPDKIDEENFLPSSRSVAFKKTAWKKVKGYPEELDTCEDLVFAKNMKEKGLRFIFVKDAIVLWRQKKNIFEAFWQFFSYAKGDGNAWFIRLQTKLLFLRYFLGLYIICLSVLYRSFLPILILLLGLCAYIGWSIKKNYRYVQNSKAFIILPSLQFSADIAVLSGTIVGVIKRISRFNYFSYIGQNKFLVLTNLIYVILVLSTIQWGVPNQYHPFTYHMDEWHQLMAIKAIIKEGTTTIAGAAQIPFVYPVLSGIYLLPFIAVGFIDPFSINSNFDELLMQGRMFEILRSINIFFGIGSIFLLYYIAKNYLKINTVLPIIFFSFSPILLTLSGYFKYDIGLLFFIVLSLYTLFKFGKEPTLKNYLFAAIASSFAFSVKFSAIPLFLLLVFAFFLFVPGKQRRYWWIPTAGVVSVITFVLVGSPNILFGIADYRDLLYSNLVSGPTGTDNYMLGMPWWQYLVTINFPLLFGHIFYIFGLISAFFVALVLLLTKKKQQLITKNYLFLLSAFLLFAASLIPLKLGAIGNRVLPLLPFLALLVGIMFTFLYKKTQGTARTFFILFVGLLVIVQFLQSLSWIYTKIQVDPQYESSVWIEENITKGSVIGIENIPIYQALPNVVLREFYMLQDGVRFQNLFTYQVVNCQDKQLPNIIVLTNSEMETAILKQSPKKCFTQRLSQEGYKKIANFSPDFTYYKLFAKNNDYVLTGMLAAPESISIYQKK